MTYSKIIQNYFRVVKLLNNYYISIQTKNEKENIYLLYTVNQKSLRNSSHSSHSSVLNRKLPDSTLLTHYTSFWLGLNLGHWFWNHKFLIVFKSRALILEYSLIFRSLTETIAFLITSLNLHFERIYWTVDFDRPKIFPILLKDFPSQNYLKIILGMSIKIVFNFCT